MTMNRLDVVDVRLMLTLLADAAATPMSPADRASQLRASLCRLLNAPAGLFLARRQPIAPDKSPEAHDIVTVGLAPSDVDTLSRPCDPGADGARSAFNAIGRSTRSSWPLYARRFRIALGMHDSLCAAATPEPVEDASFHAAVFFRRATDAPFGEREQAIADTIFPVIAKLCHSPIANAAPASPQLPPHLQHVLDGLLIGRSEKQIARELSLTYNTVHFYVGRLYRRFNVSSRGELMARLLNGRGNSTQQSA